MSTDEEKFDKAKQLHSSGRIKESQKIYLDLAKIYKKNHTLFYLIGTTFIINFTINLFIVIFNFSKS